MNHICTWFCADQKGEESHFPQTGQLSSSQGHQNIYWKCILVFFITSKRFNPGYKHVLFTNVASVPVIDGLDVAKVLQDLEVEMVVTSFNYKTPKGYFSKFQNQFYEFSILEHIATTNHNPSDTYLILDSDCIFLKSADELFAEAAPKGFISFKDDVLPDYVINGLSRNDMKSIFEELLGRTLPTAPEYHLGEFLLCSVQNIKAIYNGFKELWPELLRRNAEQLPKFNEEAHTLSYLYYKNDLHPSNSKKFMRRIWTNPLFYRDVQPTDNQLVIWHLPAEKTFGISEMYDFLLHKTSNYGSLLSASDYQQYVENTFGIPTLSIGHKMRYYGLSIYRKLKKKMKIK
jgi:hypothetical protein